MIVLCVYIIVSTWEIHYLLQKYLKDECALCVYYFIYYTTGYY